MDQWVLYYYQGELGESLELPNAFSIHMPSRTSSSLTFRELLPYFPSTNTNNLIFRFQSSDGGDGFVWMDVESDVAPLPRRASGEIVMKVLRIDEASVLRRKLFLKRSEVIKRATSTTMGSQGSGRASRPVSYSQSSAPSSGHAEIRTATATSSSSSGNKTSVSEPVDFIETGGATKYDTSGGNSMLDFSEDDSDLVDFGSFVSSTGNHHSSSTSSSSSSTAAPGNMYAPSAPSSASSGPSVPLPSREELAQIRKDEVTDRVNSALEFKHKVKSSCCNHFIIFFYIFTQLDDNFKREAEELEAAKSKHDQRLTVWAFSGSEKRNVRSLISTLHVRGCTF